MKTGGKKVRLLLLLVLAVTVTSLATTGTLAKYASEFKQTVSAEVAAFAGGGTVDFAVALADMVPGEQKTVDFTVCNFKGDTYSDVGIVYEIQVESTGNLPLEFSLLGKNDSGTGTLAGDFNEEGKASGGWLPLAEEGKKLQHSYELSVTWSAGMASEEYSHEIDMVTVTVTAVQEDPGALPSDAGASSAN